MPFKHYCKLLYLKLRLALWRSLRKKATPDFIFMFNITKYREIRAKLEHNMASEDFEICRAPGVHENFYVAFRGEIDESTATYVPVAFEQLQHRAHTILNVLQSEMYVPATSNDYAARFAKIPRGVLWTFRCCGKFK